MVTLAEAMVVEELLQKFERGLLGVAEHYPCIAALLVYDQ
jgi:hypothetical protein